MSDIREKLAPHVAKRVQVRGQLTKFDSWIERYRDIGRACISDPEIDGEVIAHHVWVFGVGHWLDHKPNVGKQVEFEAIVSPYTDKAGKQNYCLRNPDELIVLYAAPALMIPEPPHEYETPAPEPEPDDDAPERMDPLQIMREVKTFTKECGGLEQAERIALALQNVTIPLPYLIEWLKAMRDE